MSQPAPQHQSTNQLQSGLLWFLWVIATIIGGVLGFIVFQFTYLMLGITLTGEKYVLLLD
jgi:hypothetical protein